MKKTKRFILYCEPCGNKQIIEEIDNCDLREIQTCCIQTNLPKLDPATNKTVPSKTSTRSKMFKCSRCGRGVVAKQMPASYTNVIEKREKNIVDQKKKEEMIEDGWTPSPFEIEAKKAIEGANKDGIAKKNKRS